MTYIVCTKNKSKPRKPIAVCNHCQYNKKCRNYQQYLIQKEKEIKTLNEKNQNIPMFPVESSNIISLGYNASTKTLRIEFKKNTFYDFMGVWPELFQQMMGAESKGKFFNANISKKFEFTKTTKEVKK